MALFGSRRKRHSFAAGNSILACAHCGAGAVRSLRDCTTQLTSGVIVQSSLFVDTYLSQPYSVLVYHLAKPYWHAARVTLRISNNITMADAANNAKTTTIFATTIMLETLGGIPAWSGSAPVRNRLIQLITTSRRRHSGSIFELNPWGTGLLRLAALKMEFAI